METSKRHNSVPVKDNCAKFAPTLYFRARVIRWCHLNFSPADPCCHGNEFWDKIDYNSAPVKDNNCALFAPTLLFSGPGYPIMSLKFLPCRPLLPWHEFWDKIDYNSAPWKIIALCLHLPPYTQLLGYISWQWDRYLVPQNVFLVCQKNNKYVIFCVCKFEENDQICGIHWTSKSRKCFALRAFASCHDRLTRGSASAPRWGSTPCSIGPHSALAMRPCPPELAPGGASSAGPKASKAPKWIIPHNSLPTDTANFRQKILWVLKIWILSVILSKWNYSSFKFSIFAPVASFQQIIGVSPSQ